MGRAGIVGGLELSTRSTRSVRGLLHGGVDRFIADWCGIDGFETDDSMGLKPTIGDLQERQEVTYLLSYIVQSDRRAREVKSTASSSLAITT
jgi:hypothetical protein